MSRTQIGSDSAGASRSTSTTAWCSSRRPAPPSVQDLMLVVDDLDAAREELTDRGAVRAP